MQTTFDFVIDNTVTPLLKEHGFKKKNLNYYKTNGTLIYLINIQKSIHNSFAETAFFINVGIHSAEIDATLGKRVNTQPKESECYLRQRIEKISA